MKRVFTTALYFALTTICLKVWALSPGEVIRETYTFAVKGNQELKLDKYDVPSVMTSSNKPCIIFVFGGGFAGGQRNNDFNTAYLNRLAQGGSVVVAIDYRLGMKDASNHPNLTNEQATKMLINSVFMAVEDLYDATTFVYNHADEWNINKDMIVANGSSAGGVTVLQAEYLACNGHELAAKLPDGFCYGGVIAFAGAILSEGGFGWKKSPAPILMFHGDADSNVPFDKIELDNYGIYGSKHIAESLDAIQSPYCFYKVENAAHEIAGDPMLINLDEIYSFMDKFVMKRQPLIINIVQEQIGKEEMKKDFTIEDFIGTNYR